MKPPGSEGQSFLILRPFVPIKGNNQQMTAFMVARSDPDHYGEITTYVMPGDRLPPAPTLVASTMSSDPEVSQLQTLLGVTGGGSRLLFGNLLIVPIEQSMMYVRPVYVQAQGENTPPLLRKVVVEYNNQVRVADTLPEALKLFSQFSDYPAQTTTVAPPQQGQTPPSQTPPPQQLSAGDLLARAAQDFADADAALKNGDLATYQAKIKDAQQNVAQAQQLLTGTAPGSTTTTTAPPAPSSSGAPTSTTAPATTTTSGASA
jgi:uncharacterized membrane protein (UPF0182 family)